jgi:hypothetical protein
MMGSGISTNRSKMLRPIFDPPYVSTSRKPVPGTFVPDRDALPPLLALSMPMTPVVDRMVL